MRRFSIRVYMEDVDAAGCVYHPHYLRYFERGRIEFLRELEVTLREMIATGAGMFVIRKCEIDYLAPAYLDDFLEVQTTLTRVGRASLTFFQKIYKENTLVSTLCVKTACVTSEFSLVPLPKPLQTMLKQYQINSHGENNGSSNS